MIYGFLNPVESFCLEYFPSFSFAWTLMFCKSYFSIKSTKSWKLRIFNSVPNWIQHCRIYDTTTNHLSNFHQYSFNLFYTFYKFDWVYWKCNNLIQFPECNVEKGGLYIFVSFFLYFTFNHGYGKQFINSIIWWY